MYWSDQLFGATDAPNLPTQSGLLPGRGGGYTISGLQNGVTYYVMVLAVSDGGNISNDASWSAVTPGQSALVLQSVTPACLADNTGDAVVTLTGIGFTADMLAEIGGQQVKIAQVSATSAQVVLPKNTMQGGAYTVKVFNLDAKSGLIGTDGLQIGHCDGPNSASGHGTAGPTGNAGSGWVLAMAIALLVCTRRVNRPQNRWPNETSGVPRKLSRR